MTKGKALLIAVPGGLLAGLGIPAIFVMLGKSPFMPSIWQSLFLAYITAASWFQPVLFGLISPESWFPKAEGAAAAFSIIVVCVVCTWGVAFVALGYYMLRRRSAQNAL